MITKLISDELQIAVTSQGELLIYLTDRETRPYSVPAAPHYSSVSSAPFRRDREYKFDREQTEAIRDFLNEHLPKKR